MTLPPKDHPIWQLLQALISLAGLLIVVRHGLLHHPATGVDATDAVGLALALKLAGEVVGLTPTKESPMTGSAILALISRLVPEFLAFTPLAKIAPQVAAGMGEAEQIAGASGADKLAHVKAIAIDAAQAANAQAGKTVVDPQLVEATAEEAISTAKTIVNLAHDTHVKLDAPAAGV